MRFRRLLLVARHAIAMYRALSLPRNRQKGHWGGMSNWALMQLLRRECEELQAAIWHFEHHGGSAERVAEEAADLSNFAAFISDNARASA